jgi:hypothetical protein
MRGVHGPGITVIKHLGGYYDVDSLAYNVGHPLLPDCLRCIRKYDSKIHITGIISEYHS